MKDYSSSKYPVPSSSVVHLRVSSNAFWERRRNYAVNQMQGRFNADLGVPDDIALGNNFIIFAWKERQKEIELIRRLMPDFAEDIDTNDKNFIQNFNEILLGKERTKDLLNRFAKIMNNEENTRTDKTLAPHVGSFFLGKFQTTLSSRINQFINSNYELLITDAKAFSAKWDSYFNQMVDQSINEAVRAIFQMKPRNEKERILFGEKEVWKDLLDLYNSSSFFSNSFRKHIKAKLGNNLQDIKKNIMNEVNFNKFGPNRRRGSHTGVSTLVGKKITTTSYALAGSVLEELIGGFSMSGVITAKGTQVTVGARNVTGEKNITDTIQLFSFSGQVNISDLERLTQDLDSSISKSKNLGEVHDNIQDFYDRNLKELDESFIIYTSAKSRTMGSSFNDFSNGGTQPLHNLEKFISEAGLSVSNFDDFLWTAYNALPGAIGQNYAPSVIDNATKALYAAGAKLFFDDYQTLGVENLESGGINAIHVFNINGLYLPSSIFFERVGLALTEAGNVKQYMNVSVKLPSTLISVKATGANDAEKKASVCEFWQKQIDTAKEEASFHISFLSNFFGLLSELIG